MLTFPSPLPFDPALSCNSCRARLPVDMNFTMAFQPIVDLAARQVFAYEALVRGPGQQSAGSVLSKVNGESVYAFDRACRVKAIELAAGLGLQSTPAFLSINFIPGAVYRPEVCIRTTLETAARVNFDSTRLIFEVTEGEQVGDPDHLKSIFREYKRLGFRTAIDDFGSGYAGLKLLSDFQPDIIKIDMALTRGIDQRPVSRKIVRAIAGLCADLGILVIAEGIETPGECSTLRDLGIHLIQGYLFAPPAVESLPDVVYPEIEAQLAGNGFNTESSGSSQAA